MAGVLTRKPASEAPATARRDGRWKTWLALFLIALAIGLPVVGLMRYQGPPMEEGFMLAFPEQLLHGRLPHRDFLHLYGPGSLWLLAAVFKLFGTTLTNERLVGLAQHCAVAFGMFALLRPWGRRIATRGGADLGRDPDLATRAHRNGMERRDRQRDLRARRRHRCRAPQIPTTGWCDRCRSWPASWVPRRCSSGPT